MILYLIDAVAVMLVLLGFHVAFRQSLVRDLVGRLRRPAGQARTGVQPQAATEDYEGIASVFRIAGVMIMAFSFTAAAFANLIAYYSSKSVY